MRILAIDYGTKRCGLAISDPLGITAQPLCTIPSNDLLEKVKHFQSLYEIEKIILGFPIQLNGKEGMAAIAVKKVQNDIEKKTNIQVELVDERLTTASVEKTLINADLSRKNRKKVIDKLAATVLLQEYLKKMI